MKSFLKGLKTSHVYKLREKMAWRKISPKKNVKGHTFFSLISSKLLSSTADTF